MGADIANPLQDGIVRRILERTDRADHEGGCAEGALVFGILPSMAES